MSSGRSKGNIGMKRLKTLATSKWIGKQIYDSNNPIEITWLDNVFVCLRWFYGKILRDKAEKLLYPRQEGLFLVRQSTSYADDYTLCVVR